MAMSVTQDYYNTFKDAVRKRLTNRCAVPVSGGLDSTLIAKAIYDMSLIDKCFFLCMYKNEYIERVSETFGIDVHYFEPEITDFEKYLYEIVKIWEEPFYSVSVGYFLYKEIQKFGIRVSISGIGPDELCGGYTYYNTDKYPRGLLKEIVAKTNEEKLEKDYDLLVNHHLRKNDKMGLKFNIEGRYPFLDKYLIKFNDKCFNKKLIKEILFENFDDSFINRPKSGFSMDWIDNNIIDKNVEELSKKGYNFTIENRRQKMFYCQFNIWLNIFENRTI